MKNKHLSLGSLKVKSFVTDLQLSETETIKGGSTILTTITNTIQASARTDIGCCPDVK
ncbi:MAG: pinensin family lanthipeptide [Cyclobacteriaceae bacterium]